MGHRRSRRCHRSDQEAVRRQRGRSVHSIARSTIVKTAQSTTNRPVTWSARPISTTESYIKGQKCSVLQTRAIVETGDHRTWRETTSMYDSRGNQDVLMRSNNATRYRRHQPERRKPVGAGTTPPPSFSALPRIIAAGQFCARETVEMGGGWVGWVFGSHPTSCRLQLVGLSLVVPSLHSSSTDQSCDPLLDLAAHCLALSKPLLLLRALADFCPITPHAHCRLEHSRPRRDGQAPRANWKDWDTRVSTASVD